MRGISSRRNEFGHGTRRRRDQKVWPAAPEYPIARRPDIGTEPALKAAGLAAVELRAAGYPPRELMAGGVALRECYTAAELVAIDEAGEAGAGLYAVGGESFGSALNSVERYDAAADTWTAVASMGSKRNRLRAASAATARGPLTLSELRAAGCSAGQVRAARACAAAELRAAGYSEGGD